MGGEDQPKLASATQTILGEPELATFDPGSTTEPNVMVSEACNPSTVEEGVGGAPGVKGQPGLQNKILSQNRKMTKQKQPKTNKQTLK